MKQALCVVLLFLGVCGFVLASFQKTELQVLQQTFLSMARKLRLETDRYGRMKVPLAKRNLVIYHVNEPAQDNSVDISYNNLQIFLSGISQHSKNANQQAFYIFNIAGGSTSNVVKYLPLHKPNVAHVEWPRRCGEKDTPLKTLLQLGPTYFRNFSAVFVASDKSRGPMAAVKDAQWIDEFRVLLDNNHVGIVGSSFNCEPFAHVQPHMYAIRTELLTEAVAKYNEQKQSQNVNMMQYFQDGLSVMATRLGYRIASILYAKRGNQEFFNNGCMSDPRANNGGSSNPQLWCSLVPDDVIFVKWGGVPSHTTCAEQVESVLARTAELAVQDPSLELHLPETFHRGLTYELMRQFNMELWRSRDLPQLIVNASAAQVSTSTAPIAGKAKGSSGSNGKALEAATSAAVTSIRYASALANPKVYVEEPYSPTRPKVCFFATLLPQHEPDASAVRKGIYKNIDVDMMITSLLRQTNPNWRVFFLPAPVDSAAAAGSGLEGPEGFDRRIQDLLDRYADVRLKVLSGALPAAKAWAARLDRMKRELESYDDCQYAAVTSADTLYGSEVVHNVLRAAKMRVETTEDTVAATEGEGLEAADAAAVPVKPPQIVFSPYDSRATAEHEMVTRTALRHSSASWLEHCINFESMFVANLMPYTIQPNVLAGRVDLPAVFLHRDSLVASKVQFVNIAVPHATTQDSSNQCLGCDTAFLIQHLVRALQWTSVRLPVDGLKSAIFLNPSPTLCLASGNVWFDYPDATKTGCITQDTLWRLQVKDSKERPLIDWKYTHSIFRTCLRLSEHGYSNRQDIFFT